jgi:hypothetical protein
MIENMIIYMSIYGVHGTEVRMLVCAWGVGVEQEAEGGEEGIRADKDRKKRSMEVGPFLCEAGCI